MLKGTLTGLEPYSYKLSYQTIVLHCWSNHNNVSISSSSEKFSQIRDSLEALQKTLVLKITLTLPYFVYAKNPGPVSGNRSWAAVHLLRIAGSGDPNKPREWRK